MSAGTGALTAYTAACSGARATCDLSCSAVMANLKRIMDLNKDLNLLDCEPAMLPPNPATVTACQKLMALSTKLEKVRVNTTNDSSIQNDKSTALKDKACTYAYTAMIASAAMGIASLAKSMTQIKKLRTKKPMAHQHQQQWLRWQTSVKTLQIKILQSVYV